MIINIIVNIILNYIDMIVAKTVVTFGRTV